MIFKKILLLLRASLVEGPSLLFYSSFYKFYSTKILRTKAACCPYDRLRTLLLRRSGIKVGNKSIISFGIMIIGSGRTPPAVTFGDRCGIAPYVIFVTSTYPTNSSLRVHPEVKKDMIKYFAPIKVEEDAWIGAGVTIMPGVVIGRCSVIGSGAVVTKDVAPYTVVTGIPAKVIRKLSENY